uniref:Uncharacterized protein n=1 Tax=Oryza meridionalis TaxID=40149 RepID=A0A0E0DG20_9ORYZ
METGGGPLPGAARAEVDAKAGADGIDRRESAAVSVKDGAAGPARVVARRSPGTGRRSKDIEVDRTGDGRRRLRQISLGGESAPTSRLESSRRRVPVDQHDHLRPPHRHLGQPPPCRSLSTPTRLHRSSLPPAPGVDKEP